MEFNVKPSKRNGKWGDDTGRDANGKRLWAEYDAQRQGEVEAQYGRYGDVSNVAYSAGQASPGVQREQQGAVDGQFNDRVKANEGLRASALSLSSTYAQSAAMTRAREAEGTSLGTVAEDPEVTLKKKGAPQPTSAKFRI